MLMKENIALNKEVLGGTSRIQANLLEWGRHE
jgi:hypothetical protein